MTVHVLMPVFNRLELTKSMIDFLRGQEVDEPLNLIVVDDGSTDGTTEYFVKQSDVTLLKGDGNLWWGGCIDLAFHHVFNITHIDDWVLLVNNDTNINSDFLQCLLNTARNNAPAAIGSVVRDVMKPHGLLSIGARIDSWWLMVSDKLKSINSKSGINDLPNILEVDALSGRGVIYPVSVLKLVKGMRPRLLPHYLADYELSLRVKSAGYNLLVNTHVAVYSKDEHGSAYRASSLKEKLFSVRSPSYLPAVIVFWWEASTWTRRLTAPLRVIFFMIIPWFRNAKKNLLN